MTAHALASLRAEHDIKLTGNRPAIQLIVRYDGEQHRERTAEDRVAAALRLHGYYTSVRRLRNIDVNLTPSAVRIEGDNILLQATEHTTYHYNIPRDMNLPDTTEEETPHIFVFRNAPGHSINTQTARPALVRAAYNPKKLAAQEMIQSCDPYGYCMVYDSTGCDPYGYSPCTDTTFDNSTYCCYAEEAAYNQPLGNPPLDPYNLTQVRTSSQCDYRGLSAASYAYNWAFSNNGWYRVFGNDCTNFVSQAMREGGGFWFKGWQRGYKNWGHWWYDPNGSQNSGQTRSWTQAKALQYFIWNSGRGYNTSSICDLDYGDVLVVDWENNGSTDHAMIVSSAVNCQLGADGLFLSQHSPGRRNKSLREYLNEVPSAKFYAYWICHNGF